MTTLPAVEAVEASTNLRLELGLAWRESEIPMTRKNGCGGGTLVGC
jgi:hypothetical protein